MTIFYTPCEDLLEDLHSSRQYMDNVSTLNCICCEELVLAKIIVTRCWCQCLEWVLTRGTCLFPIWPLLYTFPVENMGTLYLYFCISTAHAYDTLSLVYAGTNYFSIGVDRFNVSVILIQWLCTRKSIYHVLCDFKRERDLFMPFLRNLYAVNICFSRYKSVQDIIFILLHDQWRIFGVWFIYNMIHCNPHFKGNIILFILQFWTINNSMLKNHMVHIQKPLLVLVLSI